MPDESETEKGRSSTKPKRQSRAIRRLLVLVFIPIIGLYALSMTATEPVNLGVNQGRLADCPASPNCVATQSGVDSQKMQPVSYSGSKEEITGEIKSAIQSRFPRARLVSETDNYLHFEFTSLIFRFVDDVEFLIDDTNKLIHFRSASRVGYSDMGANRKRMQTIVSEISQ